MGICSILQLPKSCLVCKFPLINSIGQHQTGVVSLFLWSSPALYLWMENFSLRAFSLGLCVQTILQWYSDISGLTKCLSELWWLLFLDCQTYNSSIKYVQYANTLLETYSTVRNKRILCLSCGLTRMIWNWNSLRKSRKHEVGEQQI